MVTSTYSEIRQYRDTQMKQAAFDHFTLNGLHDEIMLKVIKTATERVLERYGPTPSPFSFFVMGSAGRLEQAIWSDQDHGIIYKENSDHAKDYFLKLGKEISEGLLHAGYDFCDGDVMSCNPLWCKSQFEWDQQLKDWMLESSWESIRHLLIFIDGRSLSGESAYIEELKRMVYETIHDEHLLPRILNNTLHLKKGVGILGQFLVETHGAHSGSLNLKEKVLFPYVNAVRLLAIKEKILESSTLSRLQRLPLSALPHRNRDFYEQYFLKIIDYRLILGNHTNYESGHYLKVDKLTLSQRKELKEIIRNGAHFYDYIRKLVERDAGHGDE
jgi:CBS domain-containing protein